MRRYTYIIHILHNQSLAEFLQNIMVIVNLIILSVEGII